MPAARSLFMERNREIISLLLALPLVQRYGPKYWNENGFLESKVEQPGRFSLLPGHNRSYAGGRRPDLVERARDALIRTEPGAEQPRRPASRAQGDASGVRLAPQTETRNE